MHGFVKYSLYIKKIISWRSVFNNYDTYISKFVKQILCKTLFEKWGDFKHFPFVKFLSKSCHVWKPGITKVAWMLKTG